MGILAVLVMRQTGGGNTGHWVMEILAVLVMGRLSSVILASVMWSCYYWLYWSCSRVAVSILANIMRSWEYWLYWS